MDKQRFTEELNFITDKCASMAQEYAALRGAMNSLDGMKEKCPRVAFLKQPTIRFLNETKNLRVSKIVGVVWALSERANDHRRRLSSLSSNDARNPPTRLDKVKYSGDMTLMRLRDMYRRAVQLHPDIIHQNVTIKKHGTINSDVHMNKRRSEKALSNLCNRIDEHLADDNAWQKIEYFRHYSSHSLKFSNVAIDNGWTSKGPDYSYNELFKFGNRAAQLAIEFQREWTVSNICSGVEEIADQTKEEFDEFWMDFFENPLFYRN